MTKKAYVKHPISREKIDMLKREGYRIIDVIFMPEGEKEYTFDDRKDKKQDTVKTVEGIGTDSGDQFSNEQLHDAIEQATGERLHHKTGRDKLIATFNELNANQ